MLRRTRYLWAFLLAAAAAVLLRGLAVTLPSPAAAVLSPVNESPWELGKLVFWPYLCAALLLWRLEPMGETPRGAHCAAACCAAGLMTGLCVHSGGAIPVWGLFCAAIAGGMGLYHAVLRRRTWGGAALWYPLAILLAVAYLLLTAHPLLWGIFLDPHDAAAMAPIPF